jgi:hypothetical protein
VKARLGILLGLAAAALTAATATGALTPYVIEGDRSVGGVRIARADLADASARFGAPSATRRDGAAICRASWRRLGLTLAFLDLSGGNACRTGILVRATMTSRGAWRTSKGLRKGDSVARLRRLYPQASYRRHIVPWTGYWLVTRRACELGGYEPYPGLLARVRDGRVSALVASTAACE